MARCLCSEHDPTGEWFAIEYGYNPQKGETRKRRRSHDEVTLAKRNHKELMRRKREARARQNGAKRRRKK